MTANTIYTRRKFVGTAIGALVAANLTGCGGGGADGTPAPAPAPAPPPTTPPPQEAPQTIDLSTTSSRIVGARPVTITAALGRSADLTWALGAGSPGTLSAATGASVTYTPPALAVSAPTPVTITATSAGVTATAKLGLMPDPRQPAGLALLAGGLGGNGLIDGQGTAARFNQIAAMEVDRGGNLVVADRVYSAASRNPYTAIRVIDPQGNVRTVSPLMSLGKVSGVAFAPNGDIYFIDNEGNGSGSYLDSDVGGRLCVLRGGQITTLQSNLTGGRVLIDRAGNIYIYSQKHIMRVTAGGASSALLAGSDAESERGRAQLDGQGGAARFYSITDAAADADGNLYVTDDNMVRRITPAGAVTTVAGTGWQHYWAPVDGDATTARFGRLPSLSIDNNGNILVLEHNQAGFDLLYLVRQVTPAGVTSTVYQGLRPWSRDPEPKTGAPTSVARLRFNRALGGVQLAHAGQIDQLDAGAVRPFAGFEGDSDRTVNGVGAAARFTGASRLAADLRGNVYVLENYRQYTIYMDDPTGLYLRKITADGTVTTLVDDDDIKMYTNSIVADADGNVYVAAKQPSGLRVGNPPGGALYKVDTDGKVTLFAGSTGYPDAGAVDGTGSAAGFISAVLEGIDISGNLYVRDKDKFRKVTPQAVVTTVAALPPGLKVASNGLVYEADSDRSVIEATDAAGNKTVVVGVENVPGMRLGALPGGLERGWNMVPTGPNSFAVLSGAAVLRLLLP